MWISKSVVVARQIAYDDLAKRNVELSDKLRHLEAERDLYREQSAAHAAEARESLRLVADWMAEHQFGHKIFGTGPTLPTETPNMDKLEAWNTRQGRTRARDLVRLGEEKFLSDFREAAGIKFAGASNGVL